MLPKVRFLNASYKQSYALDSIAFSLGTSRAQQKPRTASKGLDTGSPATIPTEAGITNGPAKTGPFSGQSDLN